MIDRNLAMPERALRFVLAVGIAFWLITSEHFGLPQALGMLAMLALVWNSIYGRCYLWKWLGVSTCSLKQRERGYDRGDAGGSSA